MVKYEIVATTDAHRREMAQNMRQADRDELWSSFHLTPARALKAVRSEHTFTSLADGKVLCIYGTWRSGGPLGLKGVPWLLSTNELPKHYRYFLKNCHGYLDYLKGEFKVLENFVDTRNTLAVRWLQWLGFKLEKPEPFGADQLPFRRFSMEFA